MMKYSDV